VVFSCPPVSSTNKTDRHYITEILLKVALNTIKQTNKQTNKQTIIILNDMILSSADIDLKTVAWVLMIYTIRIIV
jgi:hypothetical protein